MGGLSLSKSQSKTGRAVNESSASAGERARQYRAICYSSDFEIVDPAPFSRNEAVANSGQGSREYRAIQTHYFTIVDNLGKTVDPAHFARKLWKESLIGEDIVEKAKIRTITDSERIAPVIDAVLAQTKLKANMFHKFLSVLKEKNSLLADTISEYYTSSLELHALRVLESVSEWEELGNQLSVAPEKLLHLSRAQCGRGPDYCREQVVLEWLEGDKGASWEKLCKALERMGREAEVRKIREQFISHSVDVPPATISHASNEDVAKEVDKLERRFSKLNLCLQNEMTESDTPVSELQHFITLLPIRIKKEYSKFLEDSRDKLSSAQSIKQLFILLNLYWNFFDSSLLEHLISTCGSEELKKDMKEYTEDLKAFRRHTTVAQLLEVCPDDFRREKPPPDFSTIVSKLDREASECTLEELEMFRRRFCNHFSLQTFVVMLASLEKSSIIVVWYIPSSEVHRLHNASTQWHSISTDLVQFEADGLVLQFASEINAQAPEKYVATTHLYLSSQGIGADEIALLSSLLRGKSYLQHIDLSGNNFGLKGAEQLAIQILTKNSILAHLDLSGCGIDADGIALVSSSLGNKLCLQYLDLSGNNFGLKGAEHLAIQILMKNSILAHLDLSGCGIDADGIALLSSSLGNKLYLQYLDLSGNKIDSNAANCLAEALTENTALIHLDLRCCEIGDGEIALLTSSLKNKCHIQYLDLRENKFGSKKKDYLFLGTYQLEQELKKFLSNLSPSHFSNSDGTSPSHRPSGMYISPPQKTEAENTCTKSVELRDRIEIQGNSQENEMPSHMGVNIEIEHADKSVGVLFEDTPLALLCKSVGEATPPKYDIPEECSMDNVHKLLDTDKLVIMISSTQVISTENKPRYMPAEDTCTKSGVSFKKDDLSLKKMIHFRHTVQSRSSLFRIPKTVTVVGNTFCFKDPTICLTCRPEPFLLGEETSALESLKKSQRNQAKTQPSCSRPFLFDQ